VVTCHSDKEGAEPNFKGFRTPDIGRSFMQGLGGI
jgi:hypothetical protein